MGFAANALAPPAAAQGQLKPPPGYEEPPRTLQEALKPLEDPNPERFKPTAPLFPKGPPGTPDAGSAAPAPGKMVPPRTMEEWKGF